MAIALCHNGESLSHSGDHIPLGRSGNVENGLTPCWVCVLSEVGTLLSEAHLWGTDTCQKLSCISDSWNSKRLAKAGVRGGGGQFQLFDSHSIVSQLPQVLWSSR